MAMSMALSDAPAFLRFPWAGKSDRRLSKAVVKWSPERASLAEGVSSTDEHTASQVIANHRPWLRDTVQSVHRFRLLPRNWDTYGGLPSRLRAIRRAEAILQSVARDFSGQVHAKPYFVGPLPDGGVTLEWRRDGYELGVDISPRGQLGFLYVEPTPDGERVEEADVAEWNKVQALISRVLCAQ
jgi:hypothetical protein